MSDEELLTRAQASAYLGLKSQTLATWTCTGRHGLPFIRIGSRAIRYRASDLEAWLAKRTVGGADDDHGH